MASPGPSPAQITRAKRPVPTTPSLTLSPPSPSSPRGDNLGELLDDNAPPSPPPEIDQENIATEAVHLCVTQADEGTYQIKGDLAETFQVLLKYAINDDELLHLVEDWLHSVIEEFIKEKESIKLKMQGMWLSHKLSGPQADKGNRQKKLFGHLLFLEDWTMRILKALVEATEDCVKVEQGGLKVDPELKERVADLLKSLLEVKEAISFVQNYDHTGKQHFNQHHQATLQENMHFVEKLIQANNKNLYRIVIIGLEKAGKSTLINALLKAEILPTDENRCTAVTTELMPSPEPFLSYSVEFYSNEEFQTLLQSREVKKGDDDDATIHREVQRYLGLPREEGRAANKNMEDQLITKLREYLDMSRPGQKHVTFGIKKVTIFTNKLPAGVNLHVMDLPGFDSPIREHKTAAAKAIAEADAFLFVTRGDRPSFTQPQIDLLNEIKQHFGAMQRSFVLVTHLDKEHTKEKFETTRKKAIDELLALGFRSDNIFSICSLLRLYEVTKPNSEEYRALLAKTQQFDGLNSGYDDFEFALTEFIKNELPVQCQRAAIDLAQKRFIPQASDAIATGRRILPDFISHDSMLDKEIETKNAEQWGELFEQERFAPVLSNAIHWKNTKIIYERKERNLELESFFKERFEVVKERGDFNIVSLEQMMRADRLSGRIQLSHHHVEEIQRIRLTEESLRCMDELAASVSNMLYTNLVEKFVDELNKVCPEQKMIFTTSLRPEQCQQQVRALIKRVARPLVEATLRWPHIYKTQRELAVVELTRVMPWVSLQVCSADNDIEVPVLMKFVAKALEFNSGIRGVFQSKDGSNNLPDALESLLKVVWKSY